jgi:hypothetical protein
MGVLLSHSPLVVIAVIAFAVVAFVLVAGFLRGSAYDQIGGGSLSFQHDGEDVEAAEIASRQAREQELRQMLEARSERLQRLGQEPLDIEAELARLEAAGTASRQPRRPGDESGPAADNGSSATGV